MESLPEVVKLRGECRVSFAFDVAHSIDLARVANAVRDPSTSGALGRTHPAPAHFQFSPPPLRITQAREPFSLGAFSTTGAIEFVVFDFGALLVGFTFPFDAEIEELVALSSALADAAVLEEEARHRARLFSQAIESCSVKPELAQVVEDYSVFRVSPASFAGDIESFVSVHGDDLARVLRAEQDPLSKGEVADALATRLAYGERDLALIDWHAAILFDDQPEDVVRVLEFANVQLLEMRFLDAQLDLELDTATRTVLRRGRHRVLGPFALRRDMERLASMQVEAAFLFERLGNTLKVSGDQFLARVLRHAGARFRLAEWHDAAQRKLAALDNVYDKLHDHAATLRAEFLELAIVLLIVFEIVLAFFER